MTEAQAKPKLLTLANVIKLEDLAVIAEQIKVRSDLRSQMVGTLYHDVLTCEIRELHDLYNKLEST